MLYGNCHLHSTYSDGYYSCEEMIQIGKKLGHKLMILTDHDTVKGSYRFMQAARLAGIQSLVGCEFSTRTAGVPFHIVGIDFDPEDKTIRAMMENGKRKQTERSRLLVEFARERGELREGLSMEAAMACYPERDYFCVGTVIDAAVKQGVYTQEEVPALREILRSNPIYEKRIKEINGLFYPQGEEVVRAIAKAGGVAVAAHPGKDFACLKPLLEAGLKGIEIRHPDCSPEQNAECLRLCEQLGLYKLGGTDHSGPLGCDVEPYCSVSPSKGYISEEEANCLWERRLG